MSTSPPPSLLEVSAQDLAQARNLHHHSKYTECAALLLTADRGAEDATALLKAALDGVRKHPRQALGITEEATASDAKKAYRKLALKLRAPEWVRPRRLTRSRRAADGSCEVVSWNHGAGWFFIRF